MDRVATAEYASPLGRLRLAVTQKGVARLALPRADGRGFAGWLDRALPGAERVEWLPALDKLRRELDEYFRGGRRRFAVDLDLRGTRFQLAVWRALCEIPYGETRSYGEVARAVRRPAAARAVGAASGANPVPLVVPCHRVIASGGKLGGYSGGLEIKRRLLALEKASVPEALL